MKKKNKKRLKSKVDFLSLPCDVVSNICSFCEDNEVLAISLTCPTLHQDVENSMLPLNVQRSNIPKEWKIPIFFPDQCHSVFFTWKIVRPSRDHVHTFVLVSRRRDNYGRTAETIVHQMLYFSFRNNPSQEYFLRHECRDANENYFRIASLEKQYIVNALTPTQKDALTACLKVGCIQSIIFRPMNNDIEPRADIVHLFMKLFVVCFGSLSIVESHAPIHAFFDSARFKRNLGCSLGSFPGNIRYAQEQVSNIFEQVLEQKEPGHCAKLPLAHDYPSRASSRARSTGILPHLLLTNEFVWDPSERRNDLEFVARIPLSYNTIALTIQSSPYTYYERIFVLFFQKKQSSLENSESPIVGKVVMGRQFWYVDPSSFDVDPKSESCFLYFVPDNSSTTTELNKLEVNLVNAIFCNSDQSACEWMKLLLQGDMVSNTSRRDRLLPVALFRDVALTLLGSDQGPHTAFKEALDANQIDTTPHGLQCIVDVCNVMMDE